MTTRQKAGRCRKRYREMTHPFQQDLYFSSENDMKERRKYDFIPLPLPQQSSSPRKFQNAEHSTTFTSTQPEANAVTTITSASERLCGACISSSSSKSTLVSLPHGQKEYNNKNKSDRNDTIDDDNNKIENIPSSSSPLYAQDERRRYSRRGLWTASTEQKLLDTIQQTHTLPYDVRRRTWRMVAQNLGTGHTPKQCRDRYYNIIKPGLERPGPFSIDEKTYILKRYRELGNRWVRIAEELPGRCANDIKNYVNNTCDCHTRYHKSKTRNVGKQQKKYSHSSKSANNRSSFCHPPDSLNSDTSTCHGKQTIRPTNFSKHAAYYTYAPLRPSVSVSYTYKKSQNAYFTPSSWDATRPQNIEHPEKEEKTATISHADICSESCTKDWKKQGNENEKAYPRKSWDWCTIATATEIVGTIHDMPLNHAMKHPLLDE
jgi:myb proto-oncogene protein